MKYENFAQADGIVKKISAIETLKKNLQVSVHVTVTDGYYRMLTVDLIAEDKYSTRAKEMVELIIQDIDTEIQQLVNELAVL